MGAGSLRGDLVRLAGDWRGRNLLWLDPTAPPQECEIKASIRTAAEDRAIAIEYFWSRDDNDLHGTMIAVTDPRAGSPAMAWVDSFHMGDGLMTLVTEEVSQSGYSVRGTYAAPPGPDWSWRIRLLVARHELVIHMDNITPAGEEAPAVEATLQRQVPN